MGLLKKDNLSETDYYLVLIKTELLLQQAPGQVLGGLLNCLPGNPLRQQSPSVPHQAQGPSQLQPPPVQHSFPRFLSFPDEGA